jgi:hypothetical protein
VRAPILAAMNQDGPVIASISYNTGLPKLRSAVGGLPVSIADTRAGRMTLRSRRVCR